MAQDQEEQPDQLATMTRSDLHPRPSHPWPASIALVVAVVLLIVGLAMMSTYP